MAPRHINIFLSSPGDVADERTYARQIIDDELPKKPMFRGRLTFDAVSWDDPNAPVPLDATITPQAAVNRQLPRPSECDIVIVILWARMGTQLPDAFGHKPDGTPYLSGTEWEFLDAVQGNPKPQILVYRRSERPALDPADPDAMAKIEQFRRVETFFQTSFRNTDGSLKGAFTTYETPQAFRDRLRQDLEACLVDRLGTAEDARAADVVVDPPSASVYRDIAKALKAGNVIPIIGSDMLTAGRPTDARWDKRAPAFLPSGAELAAFLAEGAAYPLHTTRADLTVVSSYYEAFKTRSVLRDRLRETLLPETIGTVPIPTLYRVFAEVETPMLIVSSTYDTLLERAYQAAGRPYDLVVYPTDKKELANSMLHWRHGAAEPETPAPNLLDVDLATTTVIFKIHGSLIADNDEWDSFVITEEDYVDFLARLATKTAIPSSLAAHFQDRGLLFVGYSLTDWNLRIFVRGLKRFFEKRKAATDEEGDIRSWTIQSAPTSLEVKIWEKRGVDPYAVDYETFATGLRDRLAK